MVEPRSDLHVGYMDPTDRASKPTSRDWGSQLRGRLGRFAYRLLVLAMASVLASGVGHAVASPPESAGTIDDITSLIRERTHPPAGFEAELGYTPISRDGLLLDPDGGCSTPGRIGPSSFDTACKAHDFGYDVLRFALAIGRRPHPSARFAADRLLYQDLLETCSTHRCEATAALYFTAVSANSLRQGYQAPAREPATPWAVLVMGVILLAWLDPCRLRMMVRWLRSTTSRVVSRSHHRHSRKPREVFHFDPIEGGQLRRGKVRKSGIFLWSQGPGTARESAGIPRRVCRGETRPEHKSRDEPEPLKSAGGSWVNDPSHPSLSEVELDHLGVVIRGVVADHPTRDHLEIRGVENPVDPPSGHPSIVPVAGRVCVLWRQGG